MRFVRWFVIVATLGAVVASPVLFRSVPSPSPESAYAAVAMSNANEDNENNNNNNSNGNDNNNNSNSNGNDNNSNGNGNGNDNVECFPDLNSNDNVPCNFNGNGNGNGNENVGHGGDNSLTGTTKCFDIQEVGLVQRSFGDGDVTLSVPPDAGFSAVTRISLHSLDPASVPAPTGGTLVDSLVWTVDAQAGCDGPAIVSLPGGMNMGITYHVPSVDKSKVQIVMLSGGTWTNVTTVPDPNPTNPYVSASITSGGTYALVQKP